MTWTTIDNADIDTDSPVTQPLMTALRDNPIAIANGDVGAPRVVVAALSTGDVAARNDWIRLGYAPTQHNEVGALCLARNLDGGDTQAPNETVAGSNLDPSNAAGTDGGYANLSGTWRTLGWANSGSTSDTQTTLFIRVS